MPPDPLGPTGSNGGPVTTEPTGFDRLCVRVAEHLTLVVAVSLVVALVGGWVTYVAYVAPETEDRVVGEVDGDGQFAYGATVQRDNPVYETGTHLDDRRHFITGISPELNGTYTYEYAAANVTDVRVETVLSLRIRAVDGDAEYWETTERLAADRAEAQDGTVEVPFRINVSSVTARVERIDAEMGRTPGSVEMTLLARTRVRGTVGDTTLRGVETTTLPVGTTDTTYEVGDAEDEVESAPAVAERGEVRGQGGPIRSYAGPFALFVGLFGLGALGAGHYRGDLPPSASVRARVAKDRTREALDEWITRGRVPEEYRMDPVIEVTSLGGIVDVAIDGDERVIEDVDRGGYYVVDDRTMYVYRPDGTRPAASVDVTKVNRPDGSTDDPVSTNGGSGDERHRGSDGDDDHRGDDRDGGSGGDGGTGGDETPFEWVDGD